MRIRCLALALSLMAVAPVPAQTAPDWPTVIAAVTPSVARVEISAAGKHATCTGVVINADPGWVVTCAHCVAHESQDRLAITVNGRHAEFATDNELLDLAVLHFKPKAEKAVTLATALPPPGTDVAILGYPFGVDELMPQFGHVSGYNRESRRLWLNVDVIWGDSGGLAFDSQGRLVGITSSIFAQGPAHMGAAIPLSAVADFIEDFLPGATHPADPKAIRK